MEKYTKLTKHDFSHSSDLKRVIRVVPSFFWLILVGATLVIIVSALWVSHGWVKTTVSMNGVYHPGGSEYGEIICFPNISTGKIIREGMHVTASLSTEDQSINGSIKGKVSYTAEYITSEEEMLELLGDQSLVNAFYQNAPVVCIICRLNEDPDTVNGFEWTSTNGYEPVLKDGTLFYVTVTTGRNRPLWNQF